MKTIAYIDGGNLYFGLLRRRPGCKWLDLRSFTRALLNETHELVAIKYFTARVKTYPYDAAAVERQNVYLQAIKAHGGIEIIEGYYNKNKIWIPAIDPNCQNCASSTNGYVHVMKMEEKRSDVNIVTEMLRDAYTNAADSIMLISGDADFIAPLDLIRYELEKQVLVFNPHQRATDLRFHATYCRDIPPDFPARYQLPNDIPLADGRTIHRPPAWA
jgi:uncharacterized LabA/DUF88 family protein